MDFEVSLPLRCTKMVRWLAPHQKGSLISITARPGAQKTEIVGEFNGKLKLKIGAQPEDGKANAELMEFLSKRLGISKKKIFLLQGESSTEKLVLIELPTELVISKLTAPGPY